MMKRSPRSAVVPVTLPESRRHRPTPGVERGAEVHQLRHVHTVREVGTTGPFEQPGGAGDRGVGTGHPEPRALVHREDRAVALLAELRDPLVAALAHERGVGIGIDVVEVDLERHEAERGERGRAADRHVVGGADAGTGDVRAGGRAHVAGQPGPHPHAEFLHHTEADQRVEQPERVAAAHHDDVGLEDGPLRRRRSMRRLGLDAERSERLDGPVGVVVPVGKRVRHERDGPAVGDGGEGSGRVGVHRFAVVRRVRQQQQFHHRESRGSDVADPHRGPVAGCGVRRRRARGRRATLRDTPRGR